MLILLERLAYDDSCITSPYPLMYITCHHDRLPLDVFHSKPRWREVEREGDMVMVGAVKKSTSTEIIRLKVAFQL